MTDIITAVKGFKDIIPPETDKWRHIEETAHKVFRAFGFREIRIPLLEKTDLFCRGIGNPPISSKRRCTPSSTEARNP